MAITQCTTTRVILPNNRSVAFELDEGAEVVKASIVADDPAVLHLDLDGRSLTRLIDALSFMRSQLI